MGKPKVSNRVTVDCIREVKDYLGEESFNQMCKEYAFVDYLCKLTKFPIQSPTMQWLLSIGEIEDKQGPHKRYLKFNIGGSIHKFGHVEFAIITGLKFGEYPIVEEEAETSLSIFFGTKKPVFSEVMKNVKEGEVLNREASVIRKIGVIYILHRMVFYKEPGLLVHSKLMRLVDDKDMFNAYPWGRLVYEDLMRDWASMLSRLKKEHGLVYLKTGTFPFAIQAWVLECLMPEVASILARRVNGNPIPRIYRWDTSHERTGVYSEARQDIYGCENVQFMRITIEQEELDTEYYNSVQAYIDHNPTLIISGKGGDDENVPLNLTLSLKKLENKMTVGFKRMEARMTEGFKKMEEKIACLGDRVTKLEKSTLDAKRIDIIVAKRVKDYNAYQFEVGTHQMEMRLREELNLPQRNNSAPANVVVDIEAGNTKEMVAVDDNAEGDFKVSEAYNDDEIQGDIEGGRPEHSLEDDKNPIVEESGRLDLVLVDENKQYGEDDGRQLNLVDKESKAVGKDDGRPKRIIKRAASVKSPYIQEAKKAKKKIEDADKILGKKKSETTKSEVSHVSNDDSMGDSDFEEFPPPYEPTKIFPSKRRKQLISKWVAKNASRSEDVGLVTCVRSMELLSCKNLDLLISSRGWLNNEILITIQFTFTLVYCLIMESYTADLRMFTLLYNEFTLLYDS